MNRRTPNFRVGVRRETRITSVTRLNGPVGSVNGEDCSFRNQQHRRSLRYNPTTSIDFSANGAACSSHARCCNEPTSCCSTKRSRLSTRRRCHACCRACSTWLRRWSSSRIREDKTKPSFISREPTSVELIATAIRECQPNGSDHARR